ncbi:MAG: hypothetical protein A9Z00_02770 [Thermobacillus sp. ZCTH02-B1]|nr:MAG: hypothetical protein A9Z00_02770 [Thermobacillus sp. ZCTH02-B1]
MDVLDVLGFLFFSALEWLALIVFTFAIFKFQLPGYWGRLLLASFMLSLVSYMIFMELELVMYGPLIQIPIVILYFWQNFRIPVFYAGLMVVNGYVFYTLTQAAILIVFQALGITIIPNEAEAFGAQTLTAGIAFLIAWLLIRSNWGFTFVPDAERVKVPWNRLNVRLLVMIILGYIVNSLYNFLYFMGFRPFVVLSLGAIALGILQYHVFKKEYHEFG